MTVPRLQILWRRNLKTDNDTLFGWTAEPVSTTKAYNIYHSPNADGPFLLLKAGIPNVMSKESAYKGKVLYRTFDSIIPILEGDDHYFKLTTVSNGNIESDIDDSEAIMAHPPQVDWADHGQDTDNYVFNFCWDNEHNRWVKGRLLATSEYQTITVGTTEQLITFNQDIYALEIQNTHPTADIRVNLNGESISTNGGMIIDAKQYYTAGRLIKANEGIMIVSSAPDTEVIIVAHS